MASAYSQPLNYSDTLQTTDVVQYTGAIQHAMQQKFDINLAKVEDLIGKVSAIPLYRDKDKQYLGDRLQKLLTNVDASSKLDLTDNTVARQLSSYISSAVDDNVKKQVSNSQRINAFNQQLADLKGKKDGGYNEANHAYAVYKAGLQEYASGETDDLGNLSYTPFVDKNKVLDELKKIKDLKGDQVIEIPNGEGQVRKTTLSGLTSQEIYQYMPQLLSSDVLNQIKIDGWARVKDNMGEAKSNFETLKKSKLETYDLDIKEYESVMGNNLNSEKKKEEAKRRLDYTKKEKIESEDNFKNIDVENPEQLGYYLEKLGYQNSIASIASGRVSEEYKKDDYYFAQKELELSQQKEAREQAESNAKLGLDANGNPVVGNAAGYVEISKERTQLPEAPALVDAVQKDHNAEYGKIMNAVATAYNGAFTKDEHRKSFNANLAKKGYEFVNGKAIPIKGKESIAKQYSSATAVVEAFNASKMNIIYGNEAKVVTKADSKRISLMSDLLEADRKGYIDEFDKDADKYIADFKMGYDHVKDGGGIVESTYNKFSSPVEALKTIGKAGLSVMLPAVSSGLGIYNQVKGETESGHSKELKALGGEMAKFVNANGGWSNLKKNIKGDVGKLKQFATLMDKVRDTSAEVFEGGYIDWGDKFYGTKAKAAAGQVLIGKNENGGGAYFTTTKNFNITSEAEKTAIANLISQKDGGPEFDPKGAPFTASVDADGNITVVQGQGIRTVKGEEVRKGAASVTFEKGDAGYERIARNIDVTQGNEGVNARVATNIKIKPYVNPEFADPENSYIIGKAEANIAALDKSITKDMMAPPLYYLTKERTKVAFENRLNGILTPEQIQKVVDKLDTDLDNFDLVLEPMDGSWGQNIKNKTNGELVVHGKFNDFSPILNDDILNLAKNYPQVLILDAILRSISKNPKKAETLFK